MKHSLTLAFVLVAMPLPAIAAELKSPDGNVVVQFDLDKQGRPTYSVSYRGHTIIAPSGLGLVLKDASPIGSGLKIVDTTPRTHDETWRPVYGERNAYRDHFSELRVALADSQSPPRKLAIVFRAYNEGAAFYYDIPKQAGRDKLEIESETSDFCFTADHQAWAVYSAQGKYSRVPLSQLRGGCERPLVVEVGEGLFAAVAEARLVDYARTKLKPNKAVAHCLQTDLSSPVVAALPLRTPWRVVMVGRTPGELLENNGLILNLNDPCAIDDTSWIKPGKVIREVTLTTVGGKACVDFAVKRGLQYIEFDAGWYGHEYADAADARAVNLDPKRSAGPLDLREVIRYADARGIGVILYVNRRALERQIDEILPLYRSWGVKGVKYGFVQVGSQQWTTWLHEAVRKAAAHRLMVDIHDEYRPTGYSRTYPNLMTQEGIGGDETRPTNKETLSILFPRMLCGAADNTICYYDKRVDENASHAYQLAKAVCIYSPWQFLFWYDRPQSAAGDEPDLEFFNRVPTVWDETRVLEGQMGEHATFARRRGNEWFVGCMNTETTRTAQVALKFLEPGKNYEARIYADDAGMATKTHVRIERRNVARETVLDLPLKANGGCAVHIVAK